MKKVLVAMDVALANVIIMCAVGIAYYGTALTSYLTLM